MIKASGYTWIAAGAVIAGALLLAGVKRAAGSAQSTLGAAFESAGELLNPASPANIFNQAVMAAGQAATGDDSWSLGGAFYDWTHPFEGYQITGNPATLPFWAQPAGYGVQAGQNVRSAVDFQLSDLIAP